MDWRLSDGKLEKYSPAEQKLFQLLRRTNDPINSTTLMELYYNGRRQPVHGRTAMNVSLKRLMQKVDQNKEPFKIVRSKRQGGEPITWQIRTRTRRR
jgi:hypothetical protein